MREDYEVPAHEGALVAVRDLVGEFADRAGLGRPAGLRLNLIVEELVSNTLAHGRPAADSVIRIRLRQGPRGVRILYLDQGRPFDPGHAPRPRASSVGGYGWQLINGFCTAVRHRARPLGNVLWLRVR